MPFIFITINGFRDMREKLRKLSKNPNLSEVLELLFQNKKYHCIILIDVQQNYSRFFAKCLCKNLVRFETFCLWNRMSFWYPSVFSILWEHFSKIFPHGKCKMVKCPSHNRGLSSC